MNYFNYNGKIYEDSKMVIGPDSRGLRYGDGLFETLKSIKGQLLFTDDHFARLWKGMNILQFKLPKHFTPETLQDEIVKLLKKNGHHDSARIRLTVYRGDGGLYDDINHSPHYLIQTWALPGNTGKWNSNGLVLGMYTDVKKSCDILSSLKHNNFLPYVMASLHARDQQWNDALILNTGGKICDTTIANIFLVKDEIIYTPSLDQGCVAGIMRKNILLQLIKNNSKAVEAEITVTDLVNADEVFLTNAIYNLRWVHSIGDIKYTNSYTQKIYSALFPTIS